MFLFPEERVGSWMKFIFPMPCSDPVQSYSMNFNNPKEESLAYDSQRLASRRLVRPMSRARQASRKLVRTPSAFLLAKRPFFTQRTIPTTERKWKVIPANSPYRGALSVQVSKMGARMVHHYDQYERQSDASILWDMIGPVLLKAFAKHGAQDFSEKYWLRLIHEGSSKTRIEYCEDSQNSLAYFRAIQGHSGGIPIDPELMVKIRIPTIGRDLCFTEVVLSESNPSSRTDSFQVEKKARPSSSHNLTHLEDIPMQNVVMITQFLKK